MQTEEQIDTGKLSTIRIIEGNKVHCTKQTREQRDTGKLLTIGLRERNSSNASKLNTPKEL